MTGCAHLLSSRSGQASCWPIIVEVASQELKSAVALVLCIHVGVSELLAHDENGEFSFPSGKAFSVSREWGGMAAAVRIRTCESRTTADCKVGLGQDWGHTPVWTGHERDVFFFLADIVAAGRERVFVAIERVI